MSDRHLPRVRSETKAPLLDRAPPRAAFAFEPGRDDPLVIAMFLGGRPPASRGTVAAPLYLRRSAVDTIARESRDAQPLEAMGLLAGTLYRHQGRTYAVARDAVTGEREATETTVRFSLERPRLLDALDALDYPYVIVGWWHSHPGYSCFLSATDVDTQRRMFPEPHHRALVFDPVADDLRAFALDAAGRAVESAWAVVGGEEGA